MKLFTIGYAQTSAESFFGRLREAGVTTLFDVRLRPRSQLSGFARAEDLEYFAEKLCAVKYRSMRSLAPTPQLLGALRSQRTTWAQYRRDFLQLIAERHIEDTDPRTFEGGCLLCSEKSPHHCHRRLVAEYLADHWDGVEVFDL